jgi:signal transduction histidine kinase
LPLRPWSRKAEQSASKRIDLETINRAIGWRIHPLPLVWADAALLRLVLVNLIANAVKFTRNRKEATIEIGCAPSQ